MKKAIVNKVNLINEMILEFKALDLEIPVTYDGGTFPYYIDINGVSIKNQFVYIDENKSQYAYNFEKRYNTNKEWGIGSMEELNHHLNLIKRVLTKSLKENK
jgi:hypothetical protein